MSRKRRFEVEIEIPTGMTVGAMQDYIESELKSGRGSRPTDDPLFSLDPASVQVHVLTRHRLRKLYKAEEMYMRVRKPAGKTGK